MSAHRRTHRDGRRRRLGQNFLKHETAEQFVADAEVRPDELVVEVGAGRGSITTALADRGARVIAIELDCDWARQLRERFAQHTRISVVEADFLSVRLPRDPYRVLASLPFGATTAILRRLLDDPNTALERVDVIVQWEVARKRAATPPTTLLSTTWAPWWEARLGARIAATEFRPIPRVAAGVLTVLRREPPLLPSAMSNAYSHLVRAHWPFR
jgi:23S rRNA (adenine-N6)-dimethyltransferase